MMLTITLTKEQEALLTAEAAQCGLRVEDYTLHRPVGDSQRADTTINEMSQGAIAPNHSDHELDGLEAWLKSIDDRDVPSIPSGYLSRDVKYAGRGEKHDSA